MTEPSGQQNDAAGSVTAYLDVRDALIAAGASLTDQIAEAKSAGLPWARLLMTDLRQTLGQLGYFRKTSSDLADGTSAWRVRYEEQHARADALADAFGKLHARVTAICDFDASESAAPEDERWALTLRGLATYAHLLAEHAAQRVAEADGGTDV